MPPIFKNRIEAGQLLGQRLAKYRDGDDVLVLALPRGGVPVAFEVARQLRVPLDVIVVRKLGMPGHAEYALGAIASGGVRVPNQDAVSWYGIPEQVIDGIAAHEEAELHRREAAYRGRRPAPAVAGKTVILVDDGIATGSTMRAAAHSVAAQHPTSLIIAVPIAPASVHEQFGSEADEIIALATPERLGSVGEWYGDFSQTSDAEVTGLLAKAQIGEAER